MLEIGIAVTVWAISFSQDVDTPQLEPLPASATDGRPAPPADSPTGVVRIESQPAGAVVLLDWKPQGRTPVSVPSVSTDRPHVLWIEASGYEGRQEVVKLAAGETRVVDVALAPDRDWYGLAAMGLTRSLSHLESPKMSDSGFRGALNLEGGRAIGSGVFAFGMIDLGSGAVEARRNNFDVRWRAFGMGLGYETSGRFRLSGRIGLALTSLRGVVDQSEDWGPARSVLDLPEGQHVTAGIFPSLTAEYLVEDYVSVGVRLAVPTMLRPETALVWFQPALVVSHPMGSP